MKQKITFFLFTLAFLPCIGLNAASVLINGLNYELNNTKQTAKVTETSGVTGSLVIPGEVKYNDITYKVTSVADWAFQYNSDITSLTLGSNLAEIGMYSFSECTGITSLIIPDNVSKLNLGSFEGCTGLTSVTIGSGLTEVVGFGNCTALTSVILSGSLKSIGWSAFQSCEKLVSITIPDGVETIDEEAFWGCIALEIFNIPQSVTELADNAFNSCNALKSINVDANNPNYSSKNGVVYNKLQTNIYLVPKGIVGPVTIPGTVIKVGPNSFRDCWSLESVIISEGITEIGNSAFRDCDKLASLTLPQSLKKVGDYGFMSCKELVSAKLPSGLTSLGYNVFTSCEKLYSINIPDGVTELLESTFSLCSSLAKVDLGNGLIKIGGKVFSGCLDLDTLVIPKSVTTIGDEAFSDCKALNSLTLGGSVATIGNKAFSNCPNIEEILTLNPVPPVCGTDVFYMTIPNNSRLYVAKGATDAYKNAEVWKTFKKVTELYEDGKKPLTATVARVGSGTIQIDGTAVETSATVKEGNDITIVFKPADGYILTSAMLDDEEITGRVVNGQYIIKSVRNDFKITAQFKEGYTVSVTNLDDLGTVTVNGKPAPAYIEKGQPVEFAVTPSAFYYVDKALLNSQEVQLGTDNTYKVASIDKNLAFEIRYEEYRVVTTEYDSNKGMVTINGSETSSYKARKGEEVKFAITAKEGYKISTVKLDDVSVTNDVTEDGVYAFTTSEPTSYKLVVTFIKYTSISTTDSNIPTLYTSKGKVRIENISENTIIMIANSQGQTVYQGCDKEIELSSGFYIVKIGNRTMKTIVE